MTNGTPIHEEPVYRLWTSTAPGPDEDGERTLGSLSGIELAVDGSGLDQIDLLRVALYPAGGYRAGHDPAQDGPHEPANGYLVEGCAPYDVTNAHPDTSDDRRFSFDCNELTGPGGERVVTVAQHETYLAANVTYTVHTVVAYRTDGTAFAVSDTAQPGLDWTQGSAITPTTPALALATLTPRGSAVVRPASSPCSYVLCGLSDLWTVRSSRVLAGVAKPSR